MTMSGGGSGIESLKDKIEQLRLQLAGCGVAALANTRDSAKQRIDRDSPYWSASYKDVCDAVDREMVLREQLLQCCLALEGALTYDPVVDHYKLKQFFANTLKPAAMEARKLLKGK